MAIRAKINPGYRRKLILIALFLGIFGGWAAYDVLVKYPPEYRRFQAFNDMKTQGNAHLWPEHAKAQGWPEEEPRRRTQGDFYFNYALMLLLPLAGWFAFSAVTAGRRWIEADDQGIRTYQGKHAPYPSITRMNERRWATKGIAIVYYKTDAGSEQHITLDDFNYETGPTRQIYDRVKAHISPDTTTNADGNSHDNNTDSNSNDSDNNDGGDGD